MNPDGPARPLAAASADPVPLHCVRRVVERPVLDELQRDLNAIQGTGWFSDVRINPVNGPLGVQVVVQVEPFPTLSRVEFASAVTAGISGTGPSIQHLGLAIVSPVDRLHRAAKVISTVPAHTAAPVDHIEDVEKVVTFSPASPQWSVYISMDIC